MEFFDYLSDTFGVNETIFFGGYKFRRLFKALDRKAACFIMRKRQARPF